MKKIFEYPINRVIFLQRISMMMGLSIIFSLMIFGNFQAHAEEYEVIIPNGAFSPHCVKADTCFSPSSLQIPENSTVEWENKDSAPHTVVSGTDLRENLRLFESSVLNFNDEFYFDFSNVDSGVYPYFCSIHPWMKGEIIVGEITVSEQITSSESLDDSSMEETNNKSNQEMKMEHKTHHLSSERVLDNYTLRLNWIQEFPIANEVNGFELIVTDSSKAKMMMSDGGMGGGCGDKGDHGDSDHSSRDDKGMSGGMGGHEGGCPHFKMVKQSVPKVAALEAGVKDLENSLKMEVIVQGKSYPIPLTEDGEFNGRYYVIFIPTIAAQYDVHVSGMIDNNQIDMNFNPMKVIDKQLLRTIP